MVSLEVDASDLQGKIDALQRNMTQAKMEQAMYGIFQRTGRHVSAILKKDLPQKYSVQAGAIGKAVKSAQVSQTSCIIPIRDKRGSIGGQYKATGGAHGWASLHKKYRVKARILAGGQSVLPSTAMAGYPPFRNLGSSLMPGTFTRTSKKRGPIMKMSGIAIPQMPLNQSQDMVQKDIHDYLKERIEARITAMIMGH